MCRSHTVEIGEEKERKKGKVDHFSKSKGVGDLQSRIVCGTHDERRGRYLKTHCRHGF